jgi:hypothetical protein
MSPIPRIAPKKVSMETSSDGATLSQLSPGKYLSTITAAEIVEGVYKSGTRVGKKYEALQVTFNLNTPKGTLTLSQRLWQNSKPEKTLFASLGYSEDDSYEPADLVNKSVVAYVDRNARGFLDIVEVHRAADAK